MPDQHKVGNDNYVPAATVSALEDENTLAVFWLDRRGKSQSSRGIYQESQPRERGQILFSDYVRVSGYRKAKKATKEFGEWCNDKLEPDSAPARRFARTLDEDLDTFRRLALKWRTRMRLEIVALNHP